ncbi:helix-turn-helix domain-containing protein [Actinomadura viridis]|uniref:helix-turn-helix domain-containing protein n=1 Tax=Actinomadura viridis TaxID=58110 RepID=UPI00367D5042
MSVRESIDPKSSLWAWLAFDLWFYRTQRGLSLAQVALIVKTTRGTVSNWEAGRFPAWPLMPEAPGQGMEHRRPLRAPAHVRLCRT